MASLLARRLPRLLPSSRRPSTLLRLLGLSSPPALGFSSSSSPFPPINPDAPPTAASAPPTAASAPDRLGIAGGSFRSTMSFVQSILAEDDELTSRKKKQDFVHLLLTRKKTFVTVTDVYGNRKTGASAGCLGSEDKKGRGRQSRYAAEATAEHVGRAARKMGIKSVVVKVKGSIFFRKKKKVIMSWRDGYRGEGIREKSPIVAVHDVTQLPHNGCRLPKKRRV